MKPIFFIHHHIIAQNGDNVLERAEKKIVYKWSVLNFHNIFKFQSTHLLDKEIYLLICLYKLFEKSLLVTTDNNNCPPEKSTSAACKVQASRTSDIGGRKLPSPPRKKRYNYCSKNARPDTPDVIFGFLYSKLQESRQGSFAFHNEINQSDALAKAHGISSSMRRFVKRTK